MKKLLSVLLSGVIMVSALAIAVPASAATVGLDVNYVSQQDIENYFMDTSTYYDGTWAMDNSGAFTSAPNFNAPYVPGQVRDDIQYGMLGMLNSFRYIAGIPSNVQLNSNYINYSQHGAVILAHNGALSHTPAKPADMPNDFYNVAYKGTSEGNIGIGYNKISDTMIYGWMADDSLSNLYVVGHRRWVLNPTMGATGFGIANNSHAMYAFDKTNGDGASIQSVAWPAQNTPVSYFEDTYPWTLSLGTKYNISNIGGVSVVLTRLGDNHVWNFSSGASNGFFNVNTDGCGLSKCIIFRPDGIHYNSGDSFNVKVYGVDGVVFDYNVNFFTPTTAISHLGHTVSTTIPLKASASAGGVVTRTCSCGADLGSEPIARIATQTSNFYPYGELGFDSSRNQYFYRYQQGGLTYRTYRNYELNLDIRDENGKALFEGQDYTVTPDRPINGAGTYSINVNYIGKYTGSASFPLQINSYGAINSSTGTSGSVSNTNTSAPSATTSPSASTSVPTPGVTSNGKIAKVSLSKVTAGKKQIVVQYKKLSGIDGYQIQYSTDKKFKKGVKTAKIKGYKTVKVTIKKLTSKKKYYVRVRAYKGKNTGAWSSVKNTTVK